MNFEFTTQILFAMVFYALGAFFIFKVNSTYKPYKLIGVISVILGILFTVLHFIALKS